MAHRNPRLYLSLGLLATLALAYSITSADTSTPFRNVVISEVMYYPLAGTPQNGCEWIELYNRSADAVSLDGWAVLLGSATGYPDFLTATLEPGHAAVVTGCDQFQQQCPSCQIIALADGKIGKVGLPNTGDNIRLLPQPGSSDFQIDAMSYGTDTSVCQHPAVATPGQSLQLESQLANECAYVAGTPSPGEPPPPPPPTPTETATATATPTPTATAAPGSVLLTEVYYQGDCNVEWVELYNPGAEAMSLVDWRLQDGHSGASFTLLLPPKGLAVLHGSAAAPVLACEADRLALSSSCLGNGLLNSGDRVELLDVTSRLIDAMSYGSDNTYGQLDLAPAGYSLARLVQDGTLAAWQPSAPEAGCLQLAPTPTATSTTTPTPTTTPTATATVPAGAALLTEVNYQGDCPAEWVEITNLIGATIELLD
ncbi:MAG: lamin tail domain-containing protein [Anaerolineae bacterium]